MSKLDGDNKAIIFLRGRCREIEREIGKLIIEKEVLDVAISHLSEEIIDVKSCETFIPPQNWCGEQAVGAPFDEPVI